MTEATQPVLAIKNGCVSIGKTAILEDINLAIRPGEFVGIIGPNGAGKSTLMQSLRGFRPVSSGEVLVAGQPLYSLGDTRMAQTIGYMQQEMKLGFGFTALEVVLTGRYPYLKWWQNETEEDHRIARKYMEFTGVEDLAAKSLLKVSGGERRRILLAKILAQETPLIFLDEPTAGLDLVYQEDIFRYCRIMGKQGKTVVLIAHDIKLAAKFCSRLILMAKGRIIADGRPEKVVTAKNLETAYGLNSTVFFNKVTGNLDIYTYEITGSIGRNRSIHVVGGGGAAGEILRVLHEENYTVSGGVFQYGDSDQDVAVALGMDSVVARPFCCIDEMNGRKNREKIASADCTVLCNLYYGEQNLDNLKAAFEAKKLMVIEDTPIEDRDFTGGKAVELYKRLVKMPQTTVISSEQFKGELAGVRLTDR